jgi:GDP/UDP-N,N'-diacetylbacillosamine 2-epimerase (hydrolysing)
VNIGDRQNGRLRAASVIECEPEQRAITSALQLLRSCAFNKDLNDCTNPYGDGHASSHITAYIIQYFQRRHGLAERKKFFCISKMLNKSS